jgi:hypothetical protein
MDPFTVAGVIALGKLILGGAVVVGVVGALVYISYLIISDLVDWFKEISYYKTSNNHAVSVKRQLNNGKRVVIQGIFDSDGDPVSNNAVRTIQYDSMSSEVQDLHREGIVEYT